MVKRILSDGVRPAGVLCQVARLRPQVAWVIREGRMFKLGHQWTRRVQLRGRVFLTNYCPDLLGATVRFRNNVLPLQRGED